MRLFLCVLIVVTASLTATPKVNAEATECGVVTTQRRCRIVRDVPLRRVVKAMMPRNVCRIVACRTPRVRLRCR